MKLYGKCAVPRVIYPLTGAVIGIDKADFALFYAVGHHRISMVLTGNIGPAAAHLTHRLICASVTVFKLYRLAAAGERKQLMTETNSENGRFAEHFFS